MEEVLQNRRARASLPELEARARRVEERVKGRPRPRVLLEIDQEPLITVGRGTIQNDLIERAGVLSKAKMTQLDSALKFALGLE